MKLVAQIIVLAFCGLTASCKSKPIEPPELIGKWDAIERWGKGPMTGSIVFYTNGSCETVGLPWGAITGNESDLTNVVSVKGKWQFEVISGKKVITINLGELDSAEFSASIAPKLKSGKWTFRQYIGDPDLMDIIEFHKR